MATKYSLVLLLLGMMVLTNVVSGGRNMIYGPGHVPLLEPEEDWPDHFCSPSTIIVGGKPISFGYPPILDPEEDLLHNR